MMALDRGASSAAVAPRGQLGQGERLAQRPPLDRKSLLGFVLFTTIGLGLLWNEPSAKPVASSSVAVPVLH